MKLDYSSLSQPVTQADMAAYKAAKNQDKSSFADKWAHGFYGAMIIIGLFAIMSIVFSIFITISSGRGGNFMLTGFWIVAAVAIAVAATAYMRHQERRKAMLYRFAVQNKLQFIEGETNPGYAGMIFDEGHSRVVKEGLVLPAGAELGNYEYVTGSGKNRSTHTYGYVKIPLKRNLPHMVLDGKANNLFGIVTGLSDSFDRSQKLSLEGDFDKYFTLYAPKEYERDALYVFTPDVMQTLIDEGRHYDMEIVDNELFIYSNVRFDFLSESQLTSLMKIIDTIGSEILAQARRYRDERAVVQSSEENVVAEKGRRLNKGVNYLILVVFIGIMLNFLTSASSILRTPIGLFIIGGISTVGLIVTGAVILSRRK